MNIKKWISGLKSGQGQKILVAVGLAGILLIMLSSLLPDKQPEPPQVVASITAEQYAAQLEERLSGILSQIEGVGSCRVLVTLENGVEYVYAYQQKSDSGREENTNADSSKYSQSDNLEQSVILVDTGNGRQGLLVTEIQPTIKGVAVICQGGNDPEVKARVTETVKTVLNITEARVCVVPGG
ncbi:MAG: hypothetical protein FWE80_04650 [Oscillospiraceae bacterium]|nr:hypothetical protein [Oscillospiraceae bacterium]